MTLGEIRERFKNRIGKRPLSNPQMDAYITEGIRWLNLSPFLLDKIYESDMVITAGSNTGTLPSNVRIVFSIWSEDDRLMFTYPDAILHPQNDLGVLTKWARKDEETVYVGASPSKDITLTVIGRVWQEALVQDGDENYLTKVAPMAVLDAAMGAYLDDLSNTTAAKEARDKAMVYMGELFKDQVEEELENSPTEQGG